jgi:RNA polymerase sigma-70 factor (ECF subfamily)
LEELYRLHAAAIHAYALRRVDRATADEVVAETFVVAWRRMERVPADPLPWLYGVARLLIANQKRAASRRTALLARLSTLSASEERRAPVSGTLEQLERMRPRDREVLLLIAWEGLSQAQVAEVLGCSHAAVRVRLHRARRRLRGLLEETKAMPQASGGEVSCDGST